MMICHCRAVNDRMIAALASAGDASLDEIMEASGAGQECGGCVSSIEWVVSMTRSGSQREVPSPA